MFDRRGDGIAPILDLVHVDPPSAPSLPGSKLCTLSTRHGSVGFWLRPRCTCAPERCRSVLDPDARLPICQDSVAPLAGVHGMVVI
jgi:hypothetical protein